MKIINRITLIGLLVVCSHTAIAQTTKDLENWNTLGLEYRFSPKFSVDLQEQYRLKENISVTDQYFTQLGFNYELFDDFEVSIAGRYSTRNDNIGKKQGFKNYFRYHADITYKHEINRFSLKYRLRYQNKNHLGVTEAEGDYPNQNYRFKARVNYNISNWKLDPSFAAEIFNHQEKNAENNGFSKYRLTLGTSYDFKSYGELTLFYRYEKDIIPELTGGELTSVDIIGLKYQFTIKGY